MGRTIVVTGSEGYLASELITEKFLKNSDIDLVIGVDIRRTSALAEREPRYRYVSMNIVDPNLAEHLERELPEDRRTVSMVHAAWTFNPTKDVEKQDAVDIGGTENVLQAVRTLGIGHLFYLGSTTAYAPLPENPSEPPFLSEDDWRNGAERRKNTNYRYSRNKAVAHGLMLDSARENPDIIHGWICGSIVIGPKTRNIVSYVAESPFTLGLFMFSILGYDPPMQYISEEDMVQVLYRGTMERWNGPVNVAGRGTVRYSEVVSALGRIRVPLPAFILYPVVGLLWKLNLLQFPPSLLDLIRYPWVGDISRLREEFGYTPQETSRQALARFAQARL